MTKFKKAPAKRPGNGGPVWMGWRGSAALLRLGIAGGGRGATSRSVGHARACERRASEDAQGARDESDPLHLPLLPVTGQSD